jgi:hypothetical protein
MDVDAEGVDEGSRAVIVVEDDGETPLSYVLPPSNWPLDACVYFSAIESIFSRKIGS